MLASLRSRAALAAALFALGACSEGETLSKELDSAEVTEDVSLTQAAFENAQTEAFGGMGMAIDQALASFGGVAVTATVVTAGPEGKMDPRSARSVIERLEAMSVTEAASVIPNELLGKTLVWNTTTDVYMLSNPAISGAPANGVRFRLYALDPVTEAPAEPLVTVGFADIISEGTDANPQVRLAVSTSAGVKVLEYVGTLGGTPTVPAFRLEGFAGVGPNSATFTMNIGVNLIQETVSVVWSAAIPGRGLTTRTSLAIGLDGLTLTGMVRRGTSKVEVAATVNFTTGGTATVKVGGAVFANITMDGEGNLTITNADGGELTAEEEATLEAIYDLFVGVFEWYDGLLDPVAAVLDVEVDF